MANYEDDWIKVFLDFLGVADLYESAKLEEKNSSISDDLIEIIRQINAMDCHRK